MIQYAFAKTICYQRYFPGKLRNLPMCLVELQLGSQGAIEDGETAERWCHRRAKNVAQGPAGKSKAKGMLSYTGISSLTQDTL